MANYTGNSPSYSLFDDEEFKTQWSNAPLKSSNQMDQSRTPSSEEPWISKDVAKDAMAGAKSGGLSGMLTSGGVSAMLNAPSMSAAMTGGGPWAIGGGLLLSELQAAQEARAKAEAERIQNEKTRQANIQNVLQQQSRSVFKV